MANRTYDSSSRAQAAEIRRQAVLDAARALFTTRGIDAVTMAEIGAAAGVGVSTIYATFSSKEGILRALMHDALFGAGTRAALARLQGEADPVQVIARTAEVACAIYEGEHAALGLLRGASAFAPSLRAIEEEFEALRYTMQEARVVELHRVGRLAPGLDVEDARRILWALTSRELYRSLVGVAGWSPRRFECWLARTLLQQLVRDPPTLEPLQD